MLPIATATRTDSDGQPPGSARGTRRAHGSAERVRHPLTDDVRQHDDDHGNGQVLGDDGPRANLLCPRQVRVKEGEQEHPPGHADRDRQVIRQEPEGNEEGRRDSQL